MLLAPFTLLCGLSLSAAEYAGSSYYEKYEFAFYIDKVHYAAAAEKCNANLRHGVLAKPKDPELNNAVLDVMYGKNDIWLGATDLASEARWLWLDNEDLYWTNWSPGEPNDMSGEDCMRMYSNGEWNDKDCCSKGDGYVCQITLGTFYTFEYSEFEEITRTATFSQAQETCAAAGARLVHVDEEAAEKMLRRMVKFGDRKLWISTTSEGDTTCAVIDKDGIHMQDCNGVAEGFLCEQVRPHALKVTDNKITASEKSRVAIECTGAGYPVPEMVWFKDGNRISTQIQSEGKSILILENVQKDDEGRYMCYATNAVNEDKYEVRTSTKLTVL